MKCINCNKEIGESPFCPYCGTKQEKPKVKVYCSACGAEMDEDAVFCMACGAKSFLVLQREDAARKKAEAETARRQAEEEARKKAEREAARKKTEDELREKGISGSLNGHDYVDLGLSVKWATCNLGASKPEDFGGYYQWGGLEDVTDTSIYLDFDNCPYHTGLYYGTGWTKYIPSGSSSNWSGSGRPDNKTVLDPEDDVAHVRLGGNWRMPTEAEFQELKDNCTSEWTTLNGVKGRKFTSKKNGNSIFLPAAGCRDSDSLYFVGSAGLYWSSSLNTASPYYAYGMIFNSGNVYTDSNYRCYGLSVRPVSE